MRFYINLIVILSFCKLFSQEKPNFTAVDSLYREDQFYIGINYGSLQKRPAGISQDKFTPSFSLGFLRDMPINKTRTIAIAAGLGYAINNFNQNILFTKINSQADYKAIGTDYTKNKLTLHYIELPLELRWRTSTPESHIFWRIYTGFKVSYLVYDHSKYTDGQQEIIVKRNKDLNPIQYGPYIAIGRNTWNLYAYYGLSPIFKAGKVNNNRIEMTTLAMGLHFYIL